MRIDLRPAAREDMTACAAILNDWIDDTAWMPRIHTHQDVVDYYRAVVFEERKVTVARREHMLLGFSAIDTQENLVTALYVGENARGQGVGSALITHAKSVLGDHVQLWTFQDNVPAQQFYAKHGFAEVKRTDGYNEEDLPDILLEWRERGKQP